MNLSECMGWDGLYQPSKTPGQSTGGCRMLIGVPVGFSFGLGGFAILFFAGIDPRFAIPAAFRSIESYTLMALPLFILAGGLISESGISRRLLNFTMAIVGRTKGGLGVVCVVTCTIFGAISGSTSGAIAAIGSIMIPEMTNQGYPRGYATGLVATSSMLALLIPPSIPMIAFAMTPQISILSAFLSTLIPGLLMMTSYSLINIFLSRRMKNTPLRSHALPCRNDRRQRTPERIYKTRWMFHDIRGIARDTFGDLCT